MADNKLTISFHYENEFGDKFSATSSAETFSSLGETDVDFIGEQLNNFLRQCGYIRNNNYIFMEDITEEEYEILAEYLDDIRQSKKQE